MLMKELIEKFPENLMQALDIAKEHSLKKTYPEFDNIVVCGLGGSGIGGRLVSGWLEEDLRIPVVACQGYNLPGFATQRTLVIASSYSGDTEETLAVVAQAKEKGLSVIAITSGGKLAQFCKDSGYDYFIVPGGNPPRTQLAFSLVLLVHVFSELKLVDKSYLNDFSDAAKLLNTQKSNIQHFAKEIVSVIQNKSIVIYSDDRYESVAIRARQQFNENSKVLCSHHVIPEMNHNELVGWSGGSDDHAVIFIRTNDLHDQNKKRFDFSKEVIQSKTSNIFVLSSDQDGKIVNSLFLINILDWASLFLAESRGVDPVEVNVISKLKSSLV